MWLYMYLTEDDSVFQELKVELQKLGIQLQEKMEKTEELVQNLLIILFTIMWKGVEGCDEKAWKQRGQVRISDGFMFNFCFYIARLSKIWRSGL